jgi:uncharacterized protein
MKAKLIKLCLAVMIVFFVPSVFAQERIIDNAGLLNYQEKTKLNEIISSVASKFNFDLVIVTENSIGETNPMVYADDFFDYKGYGLGQNRDGCLFLLVTGSRDYWFSTAGRGIDIYNSPRLNISKGSLNKLSDDVVKLLKNDNYYGAFRAFLLDWKEFLALDSKGRSYNFFYQWNLVLVLIVWVVALAIGFIVVQVWKTGMNTALLQTQAAAYVVPGSLAFKEKNDIFLYSTVTKSERQTEASSSGGGVSRSGGGGGSHTSSSGRSHGGGGGKY